MKPVPTDSLEYQTQKKNQKYNFRIALAQGILIRISFAFTDPTTVLTTFIYKLTQNNFLVGVTGSIMTTGWMWPQFLVSNLIEHRSRKLPFYILGMSSRVFCWVVICLGTFLISAQNYLLLIAVNLCQSYSNTGRNWRPRWKSEIRLSDIDSTDSSDGFD